MLHFSDGQKLARDMRHQMLLDPLESSLTCLLLVLRTLLHVFTFTVESCLQHLQLVGALVEKLVLHWNQNSGALLCFLCYLSGYVWKQGHCLPFRIIPLWRKSLGFFKFSMQRSFIPCLFFKHCLARLFQCLSSPHCSQTRCWSTSFTQFFSPLLPVLPQCLLLLFTLHCLSQHPPVVQGSLCTHFLFLWNSSNTRSTGSEKN